MPAIIIGVIAAALFFIFVCLVLVFHCSGTSGNKSLEMAGNVTFGIVLMLLLVALVCVDFDSIQFVAVH